MPGAQTHPDHFRRVAVLDIGTVTVRMAAADVCGGQIHELARLQRIVNLGEGTAATGLIGKPALSRLDEMLASCEVALSALSEERPVEALWALATSAARDAANADELAALLARHGFSLEVISGKREAQLTFAGMSAAFGGEAILASDVGGGSTELIFGDALPGAPARIRCAQSVDVGARRATELFLAQDPPAPFELDAARAWAEERLAPFFEALPALPSALISTAGVATTLASVRGGLSEYRDDLVHGQSLSLEDVDALIERLAGMDLAARSQVAGLQPQRAAVIVGGAIVQRAVLALSGLLALTVSTKSLLEGALCAAARSLGGQAGS